MAALKVGIVGLPNVGKSTLFNAITNSTVEAANYPFATIEPNIGTVEVPDERLDKLQTLFRSKKKIATTIQFVDIAGLIAGASKGEGLGNAFLNNIRETNAIVQMVRCFDNKIITHVEGGVDPVRDVEIINLELMLSDEQVLIKRLDKLAPKLKTGDKSLKQEAELLTKILQCLQNNQLINSLTLSESENQLLKGFRLLTAKPFIYVANVNDDELASDNAYVQQLKAYAQTQNFPVIKLCAKIEEDLANVALEEKTAFLTEIGASATGLELLIKTAYQTLGLKTFFTVGPEEAHSWTFKNNMTAQECAGVIHTDFARGFIKAEVYNYQYLLEYGSEKAVKENGKITLEGKNYLMKDGDICFFRFNV